MTLALTKHKVHRDGVDGMTIGLFNNGTRIGGADLRLPADSEAVETIVGILCSQAKSHGVHVGRTCVAGLTRAVEMGAVE